MNGEGQTIIRQAKCGLYADANDIGGFVAQVKELYSLPKVQLNKLGINGFEFYNRNFNKTKLMDHLEEIMNQLV